MACALILGVVALGGVSGLCAGIALLGQGLIESYRSSVFGGRASVLDAAQNGDIRAPMPLAVMLGSLVMGFAVPFPVVGWALGIYFLLIGLGGAIQALIRAGSSQG
jgi:hypothetical protein